MTTIKLSRKQWQFIGKKAGWFSAKIPQEGEFGYGLNQEAMNLLKQYDIKNTDLFRYDTQSSNFKDIYLGIQEAKKGNIQALKDALKSRFGENKWYQNTLI